MKTTAVSFRLNCTMCSSFSRTRAVGRRARRDGTSSLIKYQDFRNANRPAFTWSLCVVHMPCGALGDLERRVLDQRGRPHCGGSDRHDLVVVAVENERRHVDLPEIQSEIAPSLRNGAGVVDARGRGLVGTKSEYPLRVPYLPRLCLERVHLRHGYGLCG